MAANSKSFKNLLFLPIFPSFLFILLSGKDTVQEFPFPRLPCTWFRETKPPFLLHAVNTAYLNTALYFHSTPHLQHAVATTYHRHSIILHTTSFQPAHGMAQNIFCVYTLPWNGRIGFIYGRSHIHVFSCKCVKQPISISTLPIQKCQYPHQDFHLPSPLLAGSMQGVVASPLHSP